MRAMVRMCAVSLMLFAVSVLPLFSQSNSDVDRLLDQERATFADAAYFVLLAAGAADESESPADLFARTDWSQWNLQPAAADQPIRFGEFSYLLMQAFELSGGVMYRLAPGPRYAAREVVYRGHTRGTQAAGRFLSGDEVLRIVGSVRRAAGI